MNKFIRKIYAKKKSWNKNIISNNNNRIINFKVFQVMNDHIIFIDIK